MFENYLKNGFQKIELDQANFTGLHKFVKAEVRTLLDKDIELDLFHEHVAPTELNELRLKLINSINSRIDIAQKIYELCPGVFDSLLGPDIAVQKKANFSIQLPGDSSSLLGLHSDVQAGNSPYEIIFWLPLVDVKKTSSFYILPLEKSVSYLQRGLLKSRSEIYADEERNFVWPSLATGEALIFSPSLIHGNVVNMESHTRMSINIRFKSLFSPEHIKKMGTYYRPLNISPVTKLGNRLCHEF